MRQVIVMFSFYLEMVCKIQMQFINFPAIIRRVRYKVYMTDLKAIRLQTKYSLKMWITSWCDLLVKRNEEAEKQFLKLIISLCLMREGKHNSFQFLKIYLYAFRNLKAAEWFISSWGLIKGLRSGHRSSFKVLLAF